MIVLNFNSMQMLQLCYDNILKIKITYSKKLLLKITLANTMALFSWFLWSKNITIITFSVPFTLFSFLLYPAHFFSLPFPPFSHLFLIYFCFFVFCLSFPFSDSFPFNPLKSFPKIKFVLISSSLIGVEGGGLIEECVPLVYTWLINIL